MRRRGFLGSLAALAAGCAGPRSLPRSVGPRRLAITIDDPHTRPTPLLCADERNRRILDTLDRRSVRAALFVCGKRVDDDDGRALLGTWSARGHLLANHSYSHFFFHDRAVSLAAYQADVLRGDAIVRALPGFRPFFRFPFLKEGDTREKRDGMRAFLRERGWRVGHVTIDDSDWYVDERLRARLEQDPAAPIAGHGDYWVRHLVHRARFYDALATKVLGRRVPQTLLVHHGLATALFLADALDALRADGWQTIDPERAYDDPIFAATPDVLPAGESLLWSLAKERGTYDDLLRYPGEDGAYERDAMTALGL